MRSGSPVKVGDSEALTLALRVIVVGELDPVELDVADRLERIVMCEFLNEDLSPKSQLPSPNRCTPQWGFSGSSAPTRRLYMRSSHSRSVGRASASREIMHRVRPRIGGTARNIWSFFFRASFSSRAIHDFN